MGHLLWSHQICEKLFMVSLGSWDVLTTSLDLWDTPCDFLEFLGHLMTFFDSWDTLYDCLRFVEHSLKTLRTCEKPHLLVSDSFHVYSSFGPIKQIPKICVNPYPVENIFSHIYDNMRKMFKNSDLRGCFSDTHDEKFIIVSQSLKIDEITTKIVSWVQIHISGHIFVILKVKFQPLWMGFEKFSEGVHF